MAKRNAQNVTNGNDNQDTAERTRRAQDPEMRRKRQAANGTARKFFQSMREAIAENAQVQVFGHAAATVLEALTTLITVSLGGRIERAKAAYDALRKATPQNSDGWIPAIVYGNVAEFKTSGGEQSLALSLTDPMLDPSEYVLVDFVEDHDFSGVEIPIRKADGTESTIDGGILGLQDAIRFREVDNPASVASALRSWMTDATMAQLDPRDRVEASIKQYEAVAAKAEKAGTPSISAQQNLDTLRDNLETLRAHPSYIARDAENGTE